MNIYDLHVTSIHLDAQAILGMNRVSGVNILEPGGLTTSELKPGVISIFKHVCRINYTQLATQREIVYAVDDEHVVARLEISIVYRWSLYHGY